MKLTALDRNRPTLAIAAAMLLYELATWALTLLPDTVPDGVSTAAYGLAVAGIAAGLGYVTQQLGERAPWAFDTHAAAVAYARSLDADATLEHEDELLRRAGVGTAADAARLIGFDPDAV